MIAVFVYGLLWLSFGVLHSVLTLASVKSRLAPALGSSYRLTYNMFALVHIGTVFLIGRQLLSGQPWNSFSSNVITIFMSALAIGGILIIIVSLRQYELGRFAGLTQLRAGSSASDDEPLNIQGLNRWVRHPLYSGAFLFLWGNSNSEFGFWTALFASVYLIIGTRYEERKLISMYGDAYRSYKSSVPAYFPWKTTVE